MKNPESFAGRIRLAVDLPEERTPVVPVEEVYYGEVAWERDGVIWIGGSGEEIALWIKLLYALDGYSLRMLGIDNDHHSRAPELYLPGSRVIKTHYREFFPLGHGHNRTEISSYPVLCNRYEGEQGLLRGISVYEQLALSGFGGNSYRPLSMVDLDLSIDRLSRRVRRFLRQWAGRDAEADPQDFWDQEEEEDPDEEPGQALHRPRIWVIGGGAGSCGSAGLPWLPYLLRREASKLNLEPILYAVITGPTVYTGLHPRTQTNWAAAMLDLQEASDYGINWACADGTTLKEAAPPYWRIISFDDPAALDDLEEAESQEGEARVVPQEARSRFHAAVARSIYLAMASDALDQFEAVSANSTKRHPWGNMSGVLADACVDGLRPIVVAERVARRLELAAGSPG